MAMTTLLQSHVQDLFAPFPTDDEPRGAFPERSCTRKTIGRLYLVRSAFTLAAFGGRAALRDLYQWCGMQADWRDTERFRRGRLVTTYGEVGAGTGAPAMTARKRLRRLEQLGRINLEARRGRGGGIAITIIDYDVFFGFGARDTLEKAPKPRAARRSRRPPGAGDTLAARAPLYREEEGVIPPNPQGGPDRKCGGKLENRFPAGAYISAEAEERHQRRTRRERAKALEVETMGVAPARWSVATTNVVAALFGGVEEARQVLITKRGVLGATGARLWLRDVYAAYLLRDPGALASAGFTP